MFIPSSIKNIFSATVLALSIKFLRITRTRESEKNQRIAFAKYKNFNPVEKNKQNCLIHSKVMGQLKICWVIDNL